MNRHRKHNRTATKAYPHFATFVFLQPQMATPKNTKEPKFSNRTLDKTSTPPIWIVVYLYFMTLINFDPP